MNQLHLKVKFRWHSYVGRRRKQADEKEFQGRVLAKGQSLPVTDVEIGHLKIVSTSYLPG